MILFVNTKTGRTISTEIGRAASATEGELEKKIKVAMRAMIDLNPPTEPSEDNPLLLAAMAGVLVDVGVLSDFGIVLLASVEYVRGKTQQQVLPLLDWWRSVYAESLQKKAPKRRRLVPSARLGVVT